MDGDNRLMDYSRLRNYNSSDRYTTHTCTCFFFFYTWIIALKILSLSLMGSLTFFGWHIIILIIPRAKFKIKVNFFFWKSIKNFNTFVVSHVRVWVKQKFYTRHSRKMSEWINEFKIKSSCISTDKPYKKSLRCFILKKIAIRHFLSGNHYTYYIYIKCSRWNLHII